MQAGSVTAYVQGSTLTITGPPGTLVPATAPVGTSVGSAGWGTSGASYAGELSGVHQARRAAAQARPALGPVPWVGLPG